MEGVLVRKAYSPRTLKLVALALLLSASSAVPAGSAGLEKLGAKHGITITAKRLPFPTRIGEKVVRGTEPTEDQLGRAPATLRKLLALYPQGLLKKAPLRAVVLVGELTVDDRRVSGAADIATQTIYLDVAHHFDTNVLYTSGAFHYDPDAFSRAFHRELFHILDFHDDAHELADPAWEALNPPPFTYGNRGLDVMLDPTAGVLTDAYSDEFVRLTGLEMIVLCRDFTVKTETTCPSRAPISRGPSRGWPPR